MTPLLAFWVTAIIGRYFFARLNAALALESGSRSTVEKGLVEKGQIDRRTNSYTLTQRGKREIDARREWEDQYVSVSL